MKLFIHAYQKEIMNRTGAFVKQIWIVSTRGLKAKAFFTLIPHLTTCACPVARLLYQIDLERDQCLALTVPKWSLYQSNDIRTLHSFKGTLKK